MTHAIRKSTTTPEMYFQIRDPHTSKKGKQYKAATAFARQRETGAWAVSLVRCSIEDNFNRKQGRTIAKRRFFANPGIQTVFVEAPTFDDIKKLYFNI